MGLTSASSLKALLVNRKRKKREQKYKPYYLSYLTFASAERAPLLACDGLRWPATALHWLAMNVVGLHGPVLACNSPAMTIIGLRGPVLAFVGHAGGNGDGMLG